MYEPRQAHGPPYLTGINHRPLPVSSQEEDQQAVDSSVTLAIVIINLSTIVFCIVVSKEDFLIGPVSDLTSSLPTHHLYSATDILRTNQQITITMVCPPTSRLKT